MAVIIQSRRDSSADWTSANPILAEGELGFETDTRKFKFGDGSTAWQSLPYASTGKRRTEVILGNNTAQAISLSGMQFPILFWVAPASGCTVRMSTSGGSANDQEDFNTSDQNFITLDAGETAPTTVTFQRISGVGTTSRAGVEG